MSLNLGHETMIRRGARIGAIATSTTTPAKAREIDQKCDRGRSGIANRDFDGDGCCDLAIGIPFADVGGVFRGYGPEATQRVT
jgi:hypothetical protein